MPERNAPKRARPRQLAGYLEAITRAVFQGGISWRVVDAKWEGIREALAGFDPPTVADFDAAEIEALMTDTRVIRNRAKLEGTVDNAQTLLELDAEHGGFRRYLRSHDGFEATVADLKRQFRFLGDTGAYYFLYVVGEEVPPHQESSAAHPGQRKPRQPTSAGRCGLRSLRRSPRPSRRRFELRARPLQRSSMSGPLRCSGAVQDGSDHEYTGHQPAGRRSLRDGDRRR